MFTLKNSTLCASIVIAALFAIAAGNFGGLVKAQTTKATISGTVTDEKEAVVVNAKIIAKNLDTNLSRETTSDGAGRYRIPELAAGQYEVTTEARGFRPKIHRGIELTVGREVVVDLRLNVGNVQDKVVIEGDAALVETTTSAVKHLVNRKQVEELPLNGRDVLQLATLQNGVVSAASISDTQENIGPGMTRLIVNGARLDSNTYYLDGTDTADAFANSPGGLGGGFLGVDALREFQVLTSNYSAEFGVGGGAIINAITKSGGAQFHGAAFEFLRNSALDARNFFNAQKLPFRRNQFGGSLGGPLVKDRAFFFFNYEGLRRREGTSNIFFVPSPDARRGNLTSGRVTVAPSVLPYLALYPLPNGAINGDTGVFRRDVNESTNEDFFTVRLDHTLTSKHSLFGRYRLDDSDLRNAAGVVIDRTLNNQSHYVTLEGQSVLSPRVINTLRASYSRIKFGSAFPFAATVGPELSFVPGRPMGAFSLQGLSELRPAQAAPIRYALNNVEVSEQFIYNRDAHAFKFGGMVHRYQLNADSTLVPDGVFVYGGGVRPFLTGSPQVLFVPAPGKNFYRGVRQTLFGFYAQDDRRVILQIHYSKAAGSVQKDRSSVGLIFAKTPGVKAVMMRSVANGYFLIPPGAGRHRTTACWTPKQDIHIVTLLPHMHFRGVEMDFKAIYPDGRAEVLLNAPNYSFSWQTVYYTAKPIPIPKGTKIVVTAYFDNSSKNKYNPDPTRAVRFGDPTYDEMMVGLVEYTVDGKSVKASMAPNK